MNLEAAVRADDLATVTSLVREGADVNSRLADGLTPLMIAAGLGLPAMVKLLIAAGADGLAVDLRAGATALHKAALAGSANVAELLLEHGAFIDQQTPILGHTALMDAVIYQHDAVVRLLLERGARTSITNHWGETALELARHDGVEAIVRPIEAKNEADAEAVRALKLFPAITAGDLAEVKRLVEDGADVNAIRPMTGTPDDDYTPLALAAREGHAEIVATLLRAGADTRRTIGLFQGTALHEGAFAGHASVIRAMTAQHKGADLNSPELEAQGPLNGMTPLHDAIWHGHAEAADALVEAGHRLDVRTHAGLTPRELARHYGFNDIVRALGDAEIGRAEAKAPNGSSAADRTERTPGGLRN